MLDPSTHNRPFADKRDKVGRDGVPNRCQKMIFGYKNSKKHINDLSLRYLNTDQRTDPGHTKAITMDPITGKPGV